MKKCVVPISGGLDSTVILHLAKSQGYHVHGVSFNYLQRHGAQELKAAAIQSDFTDEYNVIYLGELFNTIAATSSITNKSIDVAKTKDILGDPQPVNYVPNRNMIMLSICSGFAESKKAAVILGYNYQSSEWYERTYKVFNKKYQPSKVNSKKDKNKRSLIEKIRSKIF